MATTEELTRDFNTPPSHLEGDVFDSPVSTYLGEVQRLLDTPKIIFSSLSLDGKIKADFNLVSTRQSGLSEKTREFEFLVTFTLKGRGKKPNTIRYKCSIDGRFGVDQADMDREGIQMALPGQNNTIKYANVKPSDWVIQGLLAAGKEYFYSSIPPVN